MKDSLKKQIFTLLDKNPLLKPKQICKLLHLNYNYHKNYIYQVKHKWKFLPRNERGSIPSIHGWRGWCFIPEVYRTDHTRHTALRTKAVNSGWIQSKSRNRFLLFKDKNYGRLQWFETGRINLYLRNPVNTGRAYQLICNGFAHTGLVTDLRFIQEMLQGVKFKSAHYVFDTKEPLPKLTIDLFGKSNGITLKIGDRSHPHGVEVIARYPDWVERNEMLFENLNNTLNLLTERLTGPEINGKNKPDWYVV